MSKRVGVNQHKKGPVNFPDPPKGDTRDLAAKAAGFGNGKTYEQAEKRMKAGVVNPVENFPEGSRTRDLARQCSVHHEMVGRRRAFLSSEIPKMRSQQPAP